MIIVHVDAQFDAAAEAAIAAGLASDASTIRELDGNLDFKVLKAPNEPGRIELIQHWDSIGAFDAYRQSALFKEIGVRLAPQMTRPPVTRVFNAVETT